MKTPAIAYTLGRRFNAVLRNAPHPVRRKILRFPALPPPPARPEGTLLVLIEPRLSLDALWAAWSWLRFMPTVRLDIVVDGVPSPRMTKAFAALFPGGHRLLAAAELLPFISGASEGLNRFCRENVYGRKLLGTMAMNHDGPLLYSDGDILAFERPDEILSHFHGGTASYNSESKPQQDPEILGRVKTLGLEVLPDINAGLFTAGRGVIDLKLASDLLADWPWPDAHRYTEQALVGAMLSRAKATALPADRYVTSWQGMWPWQKDIAYEGVKVRHFFGVVRHLLYLRGMPRLAARAHAPFA